MLFCQIVATMVATAHPKVATVERTVSKRKPGTIYVDYLQNIEGKTLACAYSARASAFAGVSTPLTWAEVHGDVRPEHVHDRHRCCRACARPATCGPAPDSTRAPTCSAPSRNCARRSARPGQEPELCPIPAPCALFPAP